MKHNPHLKYSSLLIVFLFILTGLLLTACGVGAAPKTYTIGIVNPLPLLGTTVEGFKQGMAELGYVEGKNVTYVHQEVTPMKELDAVVQDMVKAKVDLIFCTTTNAAQAAQRATANDPIPVVFTPLTNPVGAGLANSLKQPGGNITGIIFDLQEGRRLELLKQVAPTIKQIYVPYNPNDPAPVSALETISKSAPKLGLTLIPREVRNAEEVEAAITDIPEEADAIFKLADSLIGARTNDLVKASIKLKLPMSAANADAVNDGTLTGYGPSASGSGKQAARLADQILKGVKPGDLPLETSEPYFSINLKTAQAIGLNIPDEILRQADIIVR